jgi:hypothetical protein
MMIYPFTKLRDLARQGILKNSEHILTLPMTSLEAMQLVESNADELKKHLGDDTEMLVSSMKAIHQRIEVLQQKRRETSTLLDNAKMYLQGTDETQLSQVLAYGDTYCDKELVYAVGLDQ